MKKQSEIFNRNYDSIRKQVKLMTQIHKHNSLQKNNRTTQKTQILPLLGYINPQIKKQYVPRSSIQTNKISKTLNYPIKDYDLQVSHQKLKVCVTRKSRQLNHNDNKQKNCPNESVSKKHEKYKKYQVQKQQLRGLRNTTKKLQKIKIKMYNKELNENINTVLLRSAAKKQLYKKYKSIEDYDKTIYSQIAKDNFERTNYTKEKKSKDLIGQISLISAQNQIEKYRVLEQKQQNQFSQYNLKEMHKSLQQQHLTFNNSNNIGLNSSIYEQIQIRLHKKLSNPVKNRDYNSSLQQRKRNKSKSNTKQIVAQDSYERHEMKRLSYTPWKQQDSDDTFLNFQI